MSKVSYEIKGKRYTEEEVVGVYEYWLAHLDSEDINDAIDHVIENGGDKELSTFVKANYDIIKNSCIGHLPLWHDIQRNTLSSWDESIFDFALQLIDFIYYDKEGKLPH
jgi:hypothetical protein